jgi:hypothetical protein
MPSSLQSKFASVTSSLRAESEEKHQMCCLEAARKQILTIKNLLKLSKVKGNTKHWSADCLVLILSNTHHSGLVETSFKHCEGVGSVERAGGPEGKEKGKERCMSPRQRCRLINESLNLSEARRVATCKPCGGTFADFRRRCRCF